METGSDRFLASIDLESLAFGVLIVDEQGTLLFANGIAETLLRDGRLAELMRSGATARRGPDGRLERLRRVYGLTAAEAKLLSALMDGSTLQGYAGDAGISLATVKTQLAQIFAKTDCHRQSDLMREVYTNTELRMTQ